MMPATFLDVEEWICNRDSKRGQTKDFFRSKTKPSIVCASIRADFLRIENGQHGAREIQMH